MGWGGSGQGRWQGAAAGGSAWGALRAAWGCVGWSWGRGPCGWGKGAGGAVLSRDHWSVPGALAAGIRGPRAPSGVVLGAGARVHPTLLVHHPFGWCLGPVVGGFAPGTQPVSRAGEYSGCGVVWCGVVWCGVVWCGVVCRRRFYQKAKAGMSTHGYR